MGIVYSSSAKRIIGDSNFPVLNFTEQPEVVGGTSTANIKNGLNYNTIASGTVKQNFIASTNNINDEIVLTSPNDGIDVNIVGNKVYDLLTGTNYVPITVNIYNKAQQVIGRSYATQVASVNDSISYVAGTLGAHCLAQVQGLISGKTQSDGIQEYIASTNADVTNPVTTFGIHPFVGSILWNFSGVSVIRSSQPDTRFPMTLVTPRHAIIAKHVRPSVGETVVFKDWASSYSTGVVSGVYDIFDGNDLSIVYFSANIPNVHNFHIMPSGWETTYIPSVFSGSTPFTTGILPTLRIAMHNSNGTKFGSYILINNLLSAGVKDVENTRNAIQTGEIPQVWGGTSALGGDSGGPSFIVINNSPTLICSQTSPSGAVNISGYIPELETAMDTLAGAAAGTWKFTYPDLTGFTQNP